MLPGHKLPYTGLPLRLAQMIENHDGALRDLPRISTSADRRRLLRAALQAPDRPAEYGLAMAEAVAHLNHLLHAGTVSRTRRDDGAWLWQTAV